MEINAKELGQVMRRRVLGSREPLGGFDGGSGRLGWA